MSANQVNIKAQDKKDIEVISTLLQDATFRVKDLAYDKKTHQFAGLANRFRWENKSSKKPERIRSMIRFEHVLKTAYKNIPFQTPNHVLNFLSLESSEEENGYLTLLINFSGFAAIKLNIECLDGYLEDLTKSWKAKHKPYHDILDNTES